MSRRERSSPKSEPVTVNWVTEQGTGKQATCAEAPAINLHTEVIDFLADLLVADLGTS